MCKHIKQFLLVCKGYPWQPEFLSSTPSSYLLPHPKLTEVLEHHHDLSRLKAYRERYQNQESTEWQE